MTAIIYESFLHYVPTGNGWARGFEDLGIEVFKLPSVEYRLTDIDGPTDVLIVHDVNPQVASDLIEYKKAYPNTKVGILCSTYEPCFDSLKDYVNLWFNLSVQNTYLSQMFNSRGMKFKPITLAADQTKFFPMNLPRDYDVSFIGQIGLQGHGYRKEDKYLFPVIDKGYKGLYGAFAYKQSYHPIQHSKLNEVYNKTKVNFNFHYTNQKIESPNDTLSRVEINCRTFEIAMGGNFHITDHPYTSQFFGDTVPHVKEEDWLSTIDYYLENDEKRNALADEARKIALEKHTFACRAQLLLQELGYDNNKQNK